MVKKSTEESPKAKIAKKVIAPNRKYFIVAGHGHIYADDISEVEEKVRKLEQQEEGDDNSSTIHS